MVSVSNRSTYMLAQLGNGSCVSSYRVTIGATALLTTVDYSTPLEVNCSYDVLSQVSCCWVVAVGRARPLLDLLVCGFSKVCWGYKV